MHVDRPPMVPMSGPSIAPANPRALGGNTGAVGGPGAGAGSGTEANSARERQSTESLPLAKASPLKAKKSSSLKTAKSVHYNSFVRDMLDDMAALLPTFMRRQQMRGQVTEETGPRMEVPILVPGAITKVELLRDLLQNASHMTPYRWLSMAFEIFPDASDLAAALFALRGTDGLSEADTDKIDQAYQVLLATEGRQKVLSGVNAAASALQFAPRLDQSPAALRQTYRLLVMTTLTEHVMYRYLIETFGFVHRHQVIDYLEAALACDIHAADPSCTHEEFSQLWQVLYQLRLLRAADIVFLGKTQRERRRSTQTRKQQCAQRNVSSGLPLSDDERLIHILLSGLADVATLSERVVEAYDAMHAEPHRHQMSTFLQRLFNAFRMMPIELFASTTHRDKVLDTLGEPLKTLHFPGGLIGARGFIDA